MRKMIMVFWIVLTLLTSVSFAGNEGGGGDQLIIQFVSVANSILKDSEIEEHDKEILKKALLETKIVTTKVLKNPVTGEEILNQSKILAWGSKNLIQLKLSSEGVGNISWEDIANSGQPLAHLVFHELYRASGIYNEKNECPDETFQLSIGKYRLNELAIETNVDKSCLESQKLLFESYVLRQAMQRYGRDAEIKIGSQMMMTNLYARSLECIYEVTYVATKNDKTFVGNNLFNNAGFRPRYEMITEVRE